VETIRVDKIVPNKHQPRKNFDRERSSELGESIKGAGQVELIMVRPITDGRYEIISGHRRFQEQKKNGEKGISVLIKEGMDEKRSALEAFVSNECRIELGPIERASAVRNIQKLFGIEPNAYAETSRLLGQSASKIRAVLDYLNIPEEIIRGNPHLSPLVAVELVRLGDINEQIATARIAEESKLDPKETSKLVTAIKRAPEPIKQDILTGKIDPAEAIEGRERIEFHRERNKEEVALDKFEKARKILGFPDPVLGIRLHILSSIENPQTHGKAKRIVNDIIMFLTEEVEYDRVNWSGIKQLGDGK